MHEWKAFSTSDSGKQPEHALIIFHGRDTAAGGQVQHACVLFQESCYSSAGLAERGQTGQADGDGDVRWDARGGEEVGGVHEQLERLGIVEQQLVMLARGARQPSSGAAPGGPQGLGNGIVSKHDGRGRLEGEESGGHVSQGCRRAPLGVGQGCKRVIRTRRDGG